ncbi:MAG: hypothetical protein E7284_10280 [Lachnospiraceae bacterium]|nr:hypothetical protein [Lachnospiraceae bacterium]
MFEFLIKYWLEFLFGLAIAGLSFCTKKLFSKLKKKNIEDEAIKAGMIAILHDRLFQTCNQYLELGYIPLEKAEEILDNLRILYEAYHALGGNGTGTDIYNRTIKLPLKKVEK